jgi:4a-hydroxytetrahydrobiopterin dehydratase
MSWNKTEDSIEREFEFDDFLSAMEFVNRVAELSEKVNHHPEILIHSFKKVKIKLSTHDKNEITQKDYDLAKLIDDI